MNSSNPWLFIRTRPRREGALDQHNDGALNRDESRRSSELPDDPTHSNVDYCPPLPDQSKVCTWCRPFGDSRDLFTALTAVNLQNNALVQSAIDLATRAHSGQKRDDGSSTLEQHIFPLALSLIDYKIIMGEAVSAAEVAAALTHDVLEDFSEISKEEFVELLSEEVYEIVRPLNKAGLADESKYYQILDESPKISRVIKILDRFNNLSCVPTGKPEKLWEYITETRAIYLPLAEKTCSYLYKLLDSRLHEVEALYDTEHHCGQCGMLFKRPNNGKTESDR